MKDFRDIKKKHESRQCQTAYNEQGYATTSDSIDENRASREEALTRIVESMGEQNEQFSKKNK